MLPLLRCLRDRPTTRPPSATPTTSRNAYSSQPEQRPSGEADPDRWAAWQEASAAPEHAISCKRCAKYRPSVRDNTRTVEVNSTSIPL